MGSDYMQAWCECKHCASWHDDTGRCTRLSSRFDHATRTNIDVPCECFELRVAHVELITAAEFDAMRREHGWGNRQTGT